MSRADETLKPNRESQQQQFQQGKRNKKNPATSFPLYNSFHYRTKRSRLKLNCAMDGSTTILRICKSPDLPFQSQLNFVWGIFGGQVSPVADRRADTQTQVLIQGIALVASRFDELVHDTLNIVWLLLRRQFLRPKSFHPASCVRSH